MEKGNAEELWEVWKVGQSYHLLVIIIYLIYIAAIWSSRPLLQREVEKAGSDPFSELPSSL